MEGLAMKVCEIRQCELCDALATIEIGPPIILETEGRPGFKTYEIKRTVKVIETK